MCSPITEREQIVQASCAYVLSIKSADILGGGSDELGELPILAPQKNLSYLV